jgi:hypothetical protein
MPFKKPTEVSSQYDKVFCLQGSGKLLIHSTPTDAISTSLSGLKLMKTVNWGYRGGNGVDTVFILSTSSQPVHWLACDDTLSFSPVMTLGTATVLARLIAQAGRIPPGSVWT